MKVNGLGKVLCAAIVAVLAAGRGTPAPADVFSMGSSAKSLELVTVADPGNQADTRYGTAGIGAVNYDYQIGKYDVTNAQYVEFLNSVARTDTYGLYNWNSGIQRGTASGGYYYAVKQNYANRPVDSVSWAAAARFCNWLTNGQPTGTEGPATTESGAYSLNGQTSDAALVAVTRKGGYMIPTADEWYKAAYYKGGSTSAGYWDYATQSNTTPICELPPGHPGAANYYTGADLDPTYLLTDVGAYAQSPSAYGTFDQAGNIYQWTETVKTGHRVLRGGSYYDGVAAMKANSSLAVYPSYGDSTTGFRVVYTPVPEPTTLAVLAMATMGLVFRRKSVRA